MFFNFLRNNGAISSNNVSILNVLSLYKRDFEIKRNRALKAKEGCPLYGYCPYDISEPFDCTTCPQKERGE